MSLQVVGINILMIIEGTSTATSILEKQSIIQQLVVDKISRMKRITGSKEDWLIYLMVTSSELEKMVLALTDISRYSLEHQVNLYKLATIHGTDCLFSVGANTWCV